MHNPAILYPVFALASWIAVVLALIPFYRVRAVLRDYSKSELHELARVTGAFFCGLPAALCRRRHSSIALVLAWTYVTWRVIPSAIHLSYNNVRHRLTAFALSHAVLNTLWIVAGLHVASRSIA
jgi:hypothetical protein